MRATCPVFLHQAEPGKRVMQAYVSVAITRAQTRGLLGSWKHAAG